MAELDDIIVTDELARRTPRAPDYAAEARTLVALARALADAPDTILQRLAEAALDLCQADTAGISLLEHDAAGDDRTGVVFRWHAIAGLHAHHLMGMAPRDFSPCGVVVDRAAPQLFAEPGRHFDYLARTEPRIAETLLVPLFISGRPVGTVWLVARGDGRRFDAEDVRVMDGLGQFCAACLQAVHPLRGGSAALLADRVIAEQPAVRRAAAERDRLVERRVEDARRDAERLFTVLVQNVPDYAIFMLDADVRVTLWNEGAARLKGYTEREIVGQHFSVFFTPEDRERGQPEHEKGMAEAHGRYEGEGWRVRKDGTRFWGNEIITALRDADGRLVGFTKVARDLTERKRMEDALREGEERLRLLVENIRDHAVHTLDPDGRITSWNPGAERVFGFAADEIVGRHMSVLFTPEDLAAAEDRNELATAAKAGRASDDRWQVRRDGTRFWANGVTSAIRDADGNLRGFAKVCRDQTEAKRLGEQRQKLLEQEQAARLEAERAVTMKDEFLAVVSHELRTPLTSILIWSNLLATRAVKPADQPAAAETIRRSAENQRQLIDDLLDVSRMTSGKLRLNVREVDAAAVVRAAVDVVRPMADAAGVAVATALDERAGRVAADPDRLQQVVWNLLSNAVKFTPKGGRVSVGLGRLDGNLRVTVADTGRGISPGFLPFVFDRFRQADASTTRAIGGLGIGLALVRQLVELHGGTVRAESAGEGEGATFTVDLPLADVRAEPAASGSGPVRTVGGAAAAAFAPAPVLRGVRVLLAEDDVGTRLAVQALLERSGAEVVAVGSAVQALSAYYGGVEAEPFHVLVSDVGMAGGDGYALVREVREAEAERGGTAPPLPAVALTAYTREADAARALAAGFQAHVPKPFDPAALVATVARLARPAGA
ncbi:MAG: two-component regulatory system protein [Phycisphaerales bacterium]|nr:two-component regulatory system protein [Phycisphaerales bacterium]